jgi:hypothetical protein
MSLAPTARGLGAAGYTAETMIPRRFDRLPWSDWHAEPKTLEDVARPLTVVRRRMAAAMPAAAR